MNQSCQSRSASGRRADASGADLAYVRVMRRLEADIATGRLTPGERLAPERELGDAPRRRAEHAPPGACRSRSARPDRISRTDPGWFVNGRRRDDRDDQRSAGPDGLGRAPRSGGVVEGLWRPGPPGGRGRGPSASDPARTARSSSSNACGSSNRRRCPSTSRCSSRRSSRRSSGSTSPGVRCTRRSARPTRIEPSRAECLLRASSTDERTAELLGLTEGDPLLELIGDGLRPVRRALRVRPAISIAATATRSGRPSSPAGSGRARSASHGPASIVSSAASSHPRRHPPKVLSERVLRPAAGLEGHPAAGRLPRVVGHRRSGHARSLAELGELRRRGLIS